MSFLEIRNKIVQGLSEYLECPVVLNNQQNPEQNPPYVYYSAYPYNPEMGELGDYSTEQEGDTYIERRRTEPSCSFSFTVCSVDREENGEYISGEDEACFLAVKAAGWFEHVGYDFFSGMGVTVIDASTVQERSTLLVDEEARRYGFDVRIRYPHEESRNISTIEKAVTKKGESNE